jgi:hypothetical protein
MGSRAPTRQRPGTDAFARRHAAVVATGRSDEPDQINNVLAFPGHAARDPGQRWPSVQYLSMYSSGRPLVSGMNRQTKMMARPAKMA